MTIIERILGVLREGPSTAGEIALELGMDEREIGNRLGELKRRGAIVARPFYGVDMTERPGHRWRPPNLYALVSYA